MPTWAVLCALGIAAAACGAWVERAMLAAMARAGEDWRRGPSPRADSGMPFWMHVALWVALAPVVGALVRRAGQGVPSGVGQGCEAALVGLGAGMLLMLALSFAGVARRHP